jgi:hypothetical protein
MYLDEIVDLRRKELGSFFRRIFGPKWHRLVSVRMGVHYQSVLFWWPRTGSCPTGQSIFYLDPYERFARSLGFVSPLDRPHSQRLEYLTKQSTIAKPCNPSISKNLLNN